MEEKQHKKYIRGNDIDFKKTMLEFGVTPIQEHNFNGETTTDRKLKETGYRVQSKTTLKTIHKNDRPGNTILHSSTTSTKALYQFCDMDEIISFRSNSINNKEFIHMQQGKLLFAATSDLHHKREQKALEEINLFLSRCQQKNYKIVRIIHGKGKHSEERYAILKSLVNGVLRKHPAVLAFHSCQKKHGGTGAVYVRLQRQKKSLRKLK